MLTPEWPRLGFGVGLRAEHYDYILSGPLFFFNDTATTENYIDSGGRPLHVLERVRHDYPVALHGVALSIGSADPLNHNICATCAHWCSASSRLVPNHPCWTG
jgi:uncharacterized protein (UPF0276 family)